MGNQDLDHWMGVGLEEMVGKGRREGWIGSEIWRMFVWGYVYVYAKGERHSTSVCEGRYNKVGSFKILRRQEMHNRKSLPFYFFFVCMLVFMRIPTKTRI